MILDIIKQVLMEYLPPIIMIVGLIELTRRILEKGFNRYVVLQFIFCFLAGLLKSLETWKGEFVFLLVIAVVYKFLMLLSLTTLFYQLIVKKIKEAGGQVRGA